MFNILWLNNRPIVFGDPWKINKEYIKGNLPPHYPVPAIRLNTGPAWLDYWWARAVILHWPHRQD